jgi:hypothetical protein
MKAIIAMTSLFVLSGCTSDTVLSIPPAPEPLKNVAELREVASCALLKEPVEYSDPIRAPDISFYPWIVCLRSAATDQSKRQTYSLFFDKEFERSRLSAMNESCLTATYHPLPPKPASPSIKPLPGSRTPCVR